MRRLAALLFASLAAPLGAGVPLQVTCVEQPGMPPYVPEGRRYRLEGEGWHDLKIGERVDLRRVEGAQRTGRLEVTEVRETHALARLLVPGETFPLRGDVVLRRPWRALPALPSLPTVQATWPVAGTLLPEPIQKPTTGPLAPHREALYFHPHDATLSPAGREKLAGWVQTWGRDSRWRLVVPVAPGMNADLVQARVAAVRARLGELGVSQVPVETGEAAPAGRFDLLYVVQETF